jgi:tetratricopeptide (TPR) repeat protein
MSVTSTPEERARLDGILRGPWRRKSRLAQKFLRPTTDFSQILPTEEVIDLTRFPLTDTDRARGAAINWVLAPHWVRVGPNKFKIKDPIAIRDSLDEALTIVGLLEIAIQTGYIELQSVRVAARGELTNLLWSEGARRFIRKYEYTAPFFLASRVGVKLNRHVYRPTKANPSASVRFATFLSQLVIRYGDPLLAQWEAFLDDYVDFNNEQDRLRNFLKTGHERGRAQTKFKELVIGADRFVMYLANLFAFADEDERARFGQFFAYYIAKFYGYELGSRGYQRSENGVDWARAIAKSPLLGADLESQLRREVRNRFQQRVGIIRDTWSDIRELIQRTLPGSTTRRRIRQRTEEITVYDDPSTEPLLDKITPENTLAARHALEATLKRDPTSATSWAELAYILMTDFLANWNDAPDDLVKWAERAVEEALKINPSIPLAHLAKGWVLREKGLHQLALSAFDEALRSDPNLATAHVAKANQLLYLGRAQEAPTLVETAIKLSPRDPDLGRFHWILGRAYFSLGDYNKAIDELQKSIQLRPPTWFIRAQLISAYALTRRLQDKNAEAAIREYKEQFNKWRLDPEIKQFYTATKYRDADPTYKETIRELLRGLQMAKDIAGFP